MIDLLVVCCYLGGLQVTHLTLYSFDQRLHTFYLGLAERLADTDVISLFFFFSSIQTLGPHIFYLGQA